MSPLIKKTHKNSSFLSHPLYSTQSCSKKSVPKFTLLSLPSQISVRLYTRWVTRVSAAAVLITAAIYMCIHGMPGTFSFHYKTWICWRFKSFRTLLFSTGKLLPTFRTILIPLSLEVICIWRQQHPVNFNNSLLIDTSLYPRSLVFNTTALSFSKCDPSCFCKSYGTLCLANRVSTKYACCEVLDWEKPSRDTRVSVTFAWDVFSLRMKRMVPWYGRHLRIYSISSRW
jgi:hypothetical protein